MLLLDFILLDNLGQSLGMPPMLEPGAVCWFKHNFYFALLVGKKSDMCVKINGYAQS